MSRRLSNDSTKSTSSGIARKTSKYSKTDNNNEFVWDKYLQLTGMPAAPLSCFKQRDFDETMTNRFMLGDKLEAKDARNPAAISVASVVSIEGPRLCLRLDGTDGCNDFWRLIDSEDIFPLGTCEAHGGLLQPPLGFTRNVSTWPGFLQRTLGKGQHANSDCFYQVPEGPKKNLFEIGMKLEAVDEKNPHLVCPATIGDIDGDQVFVSFDGWRGAFDYWCNYDSRSLFPIGWCNENNHPMQSPGPKGDNLVVVEKLKVVAEQRKRQTRSVKSSLEQKVVSKETAVQTKEKPIRRRRIDSIKASSKDEDKEENTKDLVDLSKQVQPTSMTSDGSLSSDDSSESSHEGTQEKKIKLDNVEGENASSSQACNDQSKDGMQPAKLSGDELRKLERKLRKQKRKQRKLAKVLKRAGISEEQMAGYSDESVGVSLNLTPEQIALITSPRKRLSGIENDYLKSKLKKKKKRKKLIETSYTRMEGFGLKGSEPPITTSATSPTSPSFLDASSAPPTSLFGGDKSQIVREATQGWPTRLPVVTSDNKLGRFDKNLANQEKTQEHSTESSTNVVNTPCVSTTTNEAELPSVGNIDIEVQSNSNDASTDRTTPSPFVTSTTSETRRDLSSEDTNNAVSSTTNLPGLNLPSTSTSPDASSSAQPTSSKVTSTVTSTRSMDRRRSRNPIKWSIDDVMDYVREKEPALHNHIDVFQKHEIDGGAFLLLNSNNIVKYMSLKLGPALKLCSLVEELKASLARHSRHKCKK